MTCSQILFPRQAFQNLKFYQEMVPAATQLSITKFQGVTLVNLLVSTLHTQDSSASAVLPLASSQLRTESQRSSLLGTLAHCLFCSQHGFSSLLVQLISVSP